MVSKLPNIKSHIISGDFHRWYSKLSPEDKPSIEKIIMAEKENLMNLAACQGNKNAVDLLILQFRTNNWPEYLIQAIKANKEKEYRTDLINMFHSSLPENISEIRHILVEAMEITIEINDPKTFVLLYDHLRPSEPANCIINIIEDKFKKYLLKSSLKCEKCCKFAPVGISFHCLSCWVENTRLYWKLLKGKI